VTEGEADGPEICDLPVTVLFTPYTPERRASLEGFALELSCGHSPCRQRPTYVVCTDALETGACRDHFPDVVMDAIRKTQRSGGDHREYGLLHAPPKRRQPPLPLLPYDTDNIVYSAIMYNRYQVAVYRAIGEDRMGVLVIREEKSDLLERTVPLSYGATFGPDAGDIHEWMLVAQKAIEGARPSSDLLAEALSRLRARESIAWERLRNSEFASTVFAKILDHFAGADSALQWFLTPNAALGGTRPGDFIEDE
jgi:hypothetical protein